MIHARADYNRIQDPAGIIPDDEPVFLLRARDVSAPAVVRRWADIHAQQGGDPLMASMARKHAERMEVWQAANGSKVADLPEVPT